MKRAMLMILSALLMLPAAAAGELGERMIVKAQSAALLEAPSKQAAASAMIPAGKTVICLDAPQDGYIWSVYEGIRGYICEDALKTDGTTLQSGIALTAQERAQVNTFLTHFTRQGFAFASAYEEGQRLDWQMNDFALGYIFLNLPGKVKRDDPQGNLRIDAKEVPEITQRFFGHTPVHMTLSAYPYLGGDYFMNDFLLSGNSGFACAKKVCPLGGGRYAVLFSVYGCGAAWTMEMCAFTPEQADAAYGDTRIREGFAIIRTGDAGLTDEAGMVLERMAVR